MGCHARYAKELSFNLIKKDETVIGFTISSLESASHEVKFFCINLMSLLRSGRVKLRVVPEGRSVMLYNPENIGRSLIRFPIGKKDEVAQVKEIFFSEELRATMKVFPKGDSCCFQVITL